MRENAPYTVIIRKSVRELVGICLELNVSARGKDLDELETNLKNAIDDYLDYIRSEKIMPTPIPIEEIVEFLRDTSPEGETAGDDRSFRALELNEVPVNV